MEQNTTEAGSAEQAAAAGGDEGAGAGAGGGGAAAKASLLQKLLSQWAGRSVSLILHLLRSRRSRRRPDPSAETRRRAEPRSTLYLCGCKSHHVRLI